MVDIQQMLQTIEEKNQILGPRAHPRFEQCQDCFTHVPGYMVYPEVWAEAGLFIKGACCVTCLSKRLGRPITMDDFNHTPTNYMLALGYLLAKLEDKRSDS